MLRRVMQFGLVVCRASQCMHDEGGRHECRPIGVLLFPFAALVDAFALQRGGRAHRVAVRLVSSAQYGVGPFMRKVDAL